MVGTVLRRSDTRGTLVRFDDKDRWMACSRLHVFGVTRSAEVAR
jgi:hypothetical protein